MNSSFKTGFIKAAANRGIATEDAETLFNNTLHKTAGLFSSLPTELTGAAGSLAGGHSALGSAYNSIKGVIGNAVNGMRNQFQLNSPHRLSTVFGRLPGNNQPLPAYSEIVRGGIFSQPKPISLSDKLRDFLSGKTTMPNRIPTNIPKTPQQPWGVMY